MNGKIKMVWQIVSVIVITIALSTKTYAADFNATITSSEVTQGETVTITVTFSSDTTIGAYDLSLTYDANILDYVSGADGGGGGSLRLYNDMVNNTTDTKTITFTAKAAGTTEINVVQLGGVIDIDVNDMALKASAGTVKVNAPVIASSNNNLSGLDISAVKADGSTIQTTLSPAFSKDVTEYNLSLEEGITKLTVSATAEDAKAQIALRGTKMDPGANTTTVTVTAEDGSQKVYTIYTDVKIPETTTPQPTEPPTQEPVTPEPQTPEPPTDAPVDTTRIANIFGKNYLVVDATEETVLPEGFERATITWNGINVTGATNLANTLSLVYVLNQETGEYTFVIYNDADKTYQQFLTYSITQRSYIMLAVMDDVLYNNVPALESSELELVSMAIVSGYVDAYKLKNMSNIYIVRAMNWDNKIGYYYYNSEDGSMLPYFGGENTGSVEVSGQNQNPEVQELLNEQHQEFEKRIEKRNLLIIAMAVVIVVITIAGAYIIMKNKKSDDEDDEDDEYEDDDEYGNEEYDEDDEYEGEIKSDRSHVVL